VAALLASGDDVGTGRWGMAMTTAEAATVDLAGRMAFADAVHGELLPYARSLLAFGGAYFDQARHGRLVVVLTSQSPEAEGRLRSLLPSPNRGFAIEYASHAYSKLRAAVLAGRAVMGKIAPEVQVLSLVADERQNLVRIIIPDGDFTQAVGHCAAVERELAVDVLFESGVPDVPAVCTARDTCYSPVRAGSRIEHDKDGGASICSMGFHVVKNGDVMVLTSGHCGDAGSNSWRHRSYGHVDYEAGTQYVDGGRDAMRVGIPDSQGSNRSSLAVA